MKEFNKIINWLDSNRDLAYSIIRIFLGVALLVRGIILLTNPEAITSLANAKDLYWSFSLIMGAHLIGGILLAIGYQTRLAAAFQLPILIGAVFFIHLEQGLISTGQSLELAVLVMVLLFIYMLFGSGSLSLDGYADKKNKSTETANNLT